MTWEGRQPEVEGFKAGFCLTHARDRHSSSLAVCDYTALFTADLPPSLTRYSCSTSKPSDKYTGRQTDPQPPSGWA
ncbi:hypothetical protein CHARACLAT_015360 [Characodon lateralis]|uniref:Uncharacterized protein n=1 Tax=Characodon lateralis TaxID=208331 RepID=A0ABU7E1E2_9TELE|nr:hypothetical protein [Characodon lateralis]